MTTQIAINLNDKIELYSGSNYKQDRYAIVCHFDETFVYSQDGDNRLRISRSAIQSDDFGGLSAPRASANALPSDGQIIHSACSGDTHGCSTAWIAMIVSTDDKTATAMIINNQYCSSCWQTGCTGDQGETDDRVGEIISFNYDECGIDQYGQIVVNKL